MKALEEPKATVVKRKTSEKRKRYASKHPELTGYKRATSPRMNRRLAKGTLLESVLYVKRLQDVGSMIAREDMVRQKISGILLRLRRRDPWTLSAVVSAVKEHERVCELITRPKGD